MASGKANRPGHITTGDIFDDLGLPSLDTLEAKVKAELWRAIVGQLECSGLNQAEMAKKLKAHQPDVSHLMQGKISRFSITKLLQWAGRLGLEVKVAVKRPKLERLAA